MPLPHGARRAAYQAAHPQSEVYVSTDMPVNLRVSVNRATIDSYLESSWSGFTEKTNNLGLILAGVTPDLRLLWGCLSAPPRETIQELTEAQTVHVALGGSSRWQVPLQLIRQLLELRQREHRPVSPYDVTF
jgi:hypothetical protein